MYFLLIISSLIHLAHGRNITNVSPPVILESEPVPFEISIRGYGLYNILNIFVGGSACYQRQANFSLAVDACIAGVQKDDVCAILKMQYSSLAGTSCANNETPCFNISNSNKPCSPVTNSDELCYATSCRTLTSSCVVFHYRNTVAYASGNGYEGSKCSQGGVCSSLRCIPDNPIDVCTNEIKCMVSNVTSTDINITFSDASYIYYTDMFSLVPNPTPADVIIGARVNDIDSNPLVSPSSVFSLRYSPSMDGVISNTTFTCFYAGGHVNVTDRFPSGLIVSAGDTTLQMVCSIHVTYYLQSFLITLPSHNVSLRYVRTPDVVSACPHQILSGIPTDVLVQGVFFVNTTTLSCMLGSGDISPALFINEQTVRCDVVYANYTNSSIEIPLSVSNDGTTFSPLPVTMYVSGACDSIKPNSVPMGSVCVCTPGYQDMGGFCQQCADGFFQPSYNQESCLSCDSSEDTRGLQGSTSKDACVCKDGRYRYDDDDEACGACPEGLYCSQAQGIYVVSDYWRARDNSTVLTRCPAGTSQCAGGFGAGNALCRKGYKGPLCAVCADGYGLLGGKCVECPQDSVNGFVVFLLVSTSLLIFYFLVKTTTRLEEKGDIAGVMIKMTFSYLQILYYIGKTSAKWDGNSMKFFTAIVPVTLSSSFVSIHCSTNYGFYKSIVLMMVLPVLVIAVIAFVMAVDYFYKVVRQSRKKIIWLETIQDFEKFCLVILIMMHPTISQDVIRSFRCESVEGTGTSYLADYMSVDCSTREYKTYRVLAAIYMVAYVFGLLYYIFHNITTNSDLVKMANMGVYAFHGRVYVFFVRGYRSETYLWEFVIIARKLAVVIINSLFPEEIQMLWANIVIGLSLGVTVYTDPFRSIMANRLEKLSLCALWITVLLGMHGQLMAAPDRTAIFVLLVLVSTGTTTVLFMAIFKAMQPLLREVLDFFVTHAKRIRMRLIPKDRQEFYDGNGIPLGMKMYQKPVTSSSSSSLGVVQPPLPVDVRQDEEVEL